MRRTYKAVNSLERTNIKPKEKIMKVSVKQIHQTCLQVKLLELVPLAGESLPAFEAGAHIDLHLDNGLIRQYSLCNDPLERDRYEIGVLLEDKSRGGSRYIYESIKVGDELEISEPRNLFPLSCEQESALLLAGGIGITPLIAMAETLIAKNIDFELYYFTRGNEYIAFKDRLNEERFAGKIHFIHKDNVETAALLSEILAEPKISKELYTCGPNGFMDAVFDIALSKGWNQTNMHKEIFQVEEIDQSVNKSFKVKIASTGEVIEIPEDKSITEVLEDNGYYISVSCEQGICGTCVTYILEGEAEHHDQFLSDYERNVQKVFTPCCSRAKTEMLVLDI